MSREFEVEVYTTLKVKVVVTIRSETKENAETEVAYLGTEDFFKLDGAEAKYTVIRTSEFEEGRFKESQITSAKIRDVIGCSRFHIA